MGQTFPSRSQTTRPQTARAPPGSPSLPPRGVSRTETPTSAPHATQLQPPFTRDVPPLAILPPAPKRKSPPTPANPSQTTPKNPSSTLATTDDPPQANPQKRTSKSDPQKRTPKSEPANPRMDKM